MAITSTQPTTEFTYREITLQDRLREVAREVGDKPALLMGDRSVSFREIDQKRRLVAEDRKSTRLNSSHSQISYAVFCLKKKTPLVSATWESHLSSSYPALTINGTAIRDFADAGVKLCIDELSAVSSVKCIQAPTSPDG